MGRARRRSSRPGVDGGPSAARRRPGAPGATCSSSAPTSRARRLGVLTAAHISAHARAASTPSSSSSATGCAAVDDAELAALYAGALAVVAPSYLEGFGLPPLEAAAHGTPAVVSDLPCFAETLGDAALRVPAGDAGALADALLRIAGDDELRARLGAAARERAARYTWERAAAALHPLLGGAAA